MATKKRRIRKLTKEQRDIVHAPIKSNYGMGWKSEYGGPADPREYEAGEENTDYDPWLDA